MKLLRKVKVIEVKRSFVLGNLIKMKNGRKHSIGRLTKGDFEKRLVEAKKKVMTFSEENLDKFIGDEYEKRMIAYNASDWYLAEVSPTEVGVWKRAGGLRLSWTNDSLAETARRVKKGIKNNSKFLVKRARQAIPNILNTNISDLQNEKYLLPIIFKDGTGTNGRWRLKKRLKGDIDDGCMRSIALAINGVKTIRVYFGLPKK